MRKSKYSKYIYLFPIIICVGFLIFFYAISQDRASERHNISFNIRKEIVDLNADLISYFAAHNDDWEDRREFYLEWLLHTVNLMRSPLTISVLMDGELNIISDRVGFYGDEIYDALAHRILAEVMQGNSFEALSDDFNDVVISTYYRWVPSNQDERFLFAIGVVPGHVNEFDRVYSYGVFILVLFVLVINYAMIWKLREKGGKKDET